MKALLGSSTSVSTSTQVVTQHGEDSAWFGQGYGDPVDNLNGLNNAPGGTLPAGPQARHGMEYCLSPTTYTAHS